MICGISIVRNEIDIIEFCIWHHLDQGLNKIIICDNGSTDGTLELLNLMADKDDRIVVLSNDGPFHQEEIMNKLYDLALSMGCEWSVFFDADEIWKSDSGLANDLQNLDTDHIEIEVENFVQNTSYDLDNIYKNITWKIKDYTLEINNIMAGIESTVEYQWSNKFILKVSPNIHVGPGGHYFRYKHLNKTVIKTGSISQNFKCYQVPVRSYEHLVRKAEHGVRLMEAGYNPGHGWECQRLGNFLLFDEDQLREEWLCNSTINGRLCRPNESVVNLIEDNYVADRYEEFIRYKNGNL
jgi:glycosyltransferase involved in cell wall biosynthesis